ncbi:lytic transglycosylase domain-containing protein [Paraburkholderia sp. BL6669N2]|uniref:lytic transglycosylase domain-containing protein n=1 Tax=Paraburkholderia sp. BL6669N2 TaxID=1938807 RepID=UPI002161DED8|nr:lytic transglycosylase domain-containing protein [Paraburkholderia sp. BL6669N2]
MAHSCVTESPQVWHVSGFDRQTISAAGAKGLMQVLPTAHPQVVALNKDLSDPAENVRIGSSILRGYLDAP